MREREKVQQELEKLGRQLEQKRAQEVCTFFTPKPDFGSPPRNGAQEKEKMMRNDVHDKYKRVKEGKLPADQEA